MKTKMKQTERSMAGRLHSALKYATKANDALGPLLEETSRDIHRSVIEDYAMRADNATKRCIQELSAAIEALPVEGAYVKLLTPHDIVDGFLRPR